MKLDILSRLSEMFYVLASGGEKLPSDSDDLDIILKNIEKLETYQARKKYAEKNLKHLSSGSSRIVYSFNNDIVIKLAKNDKGIAQNKAEANIKIKSKYINKILKKSKNYSWIQVPYLEKINVKDFKKMTGLDFEEFGASIRYALKSISGNSDKEKPSNYEEVSKSDIFKDIKNIGKKNKLMPGDLARISSWGEKDNNPILIDTGLTKDVFADYYESSS